MKAKNLYSRELISLLMAVVLVAGPVAVAQKAASRAATQKLTAEQRAVHLLDRITFGPRPGDVNRVLALGWEKYLDEQLYPDRITDDVVAKKLEPLSTLTMSSAELARVYDPPPVVLQQLRDKIEKQTVVDPADPNKMVRPTAANQPPDPAMRRELEKALADMGFKPRQGPVIELQQAKVLRAVYSERQLQEVLSDFWFNHFNVFAQKGQDRLLLTSYERDVIHPNVFGKFEDLLLATAKSPAMLFYLDNWMSASPNARTPTQQQLQRLREMRPNPNNSPVGQGGGLTPAERQMRREQMQQMQQAQQARTMPNQPPQPANAQQRRPMRGINENYAREIMELHTLGVDGGYTQKDVQEVARCFTGWTLRQPRQGASFYFAPALHDDGEKTVLGQKIPANGGMKDGEMVIRILAHHPSTAKFIATKLARKFVSDQPPANLVDRMAAAFLKSDGDLRAVYKTMFSSREFWAPDTYRAKIKTPFEMTVSAVRALGADTNGSPAFHRWMQQMGEGLYLAQPPTGYKDESEQWVNTGALLQRMNFALALSSNRIPGTRVDFPVELQSAKPGAIADYFVKQVLRGNISPQTRATLDKTLNDQQLAFKTGSDIARIAGLILGSPEFQRQ